MRTVSLHSSYGYMGLTESYLFLEDFEKLVTLSLRIVPHGVISSGEDGSTHLSRLSKPPSLFTLALVTHDHLTYTMSHSGFQSIHVPRHTHLRIAFCDQRPLICGTTVPNRSFLYHSYHRRNYCKGSGLDIRSSATSEDQELQAQDSSHFLNDEGSAIVVKNLSFRWNHKNRRILDNCSFTVPRGKLYMLVGKNGCGKSTLLQLLKRILIVNNGLIQVDEPIGYVFQSPDRNLMMPTVFNDIHIKSDPRPLYERAIVGLPEDLNQIEPNVLEVIDALSLRSLLGRRTWELSGGEKQRVAVAGALVKNPKTLLFDEVTASMDARSKTMLLEDVKRITKQKGITTLWITHLADELEYADGIIMLDKGRVQAQGTYAEMKSILDGQIDEIFDEDREGNEMYG